MHYCPHCNSQIYNRKLAFCTTCYEPLPDEVRMNSEQIEKLEAEKAESLRKLKKLQRSRYRAYDLDVDID